MQVATLSVKCRSWLVKMTVPCVVHQGLGQGLHGIDVEMVRRFVQNQDVVIAQQQARQAEPGTLAAGENRDRLLDVRFAEQQGAGYFENLLILFAEGGLPFAGIRARFGSPGRLV